ncbi:hypothetical protein GOP47_0002152 [Adiantum capillus-veneris]|uniref:Uncharacterized protein n=1 Tax=Adiantum capillus-veneris TaxID=13818 RepID=A0A9D4V9U0_ADICA|nr:hypothetical protein GOP47_0002152 [Adiantum capillus-veneris]
MTVPEPIEGLLAFPFLNSTESPTPSKSYFDYWCFPFAAQRIDDAHNVHKSSENGVEVIASPRKDAEGDVCIHVNINGYIDEVISISSDNSNSIITTTLFFDDDDIEVQSKFTPTSSLTSFKPNVILQDEPRMTYPCHQISPMITLLSFCWGGGGKNACLSSPRMGLETSSQNEVLGSDETTSTNDEEVIITRLSSIKACH